MPRAFPIGRTTMLISVSLFALTLGACSQQSLRQSANVGPDQANRELNAFFEAVFQRRLARSPQMRTFLGEKTDNDKWNDHSDANALEEQQLIRGDLAALRQKFDVDKLDDSGQLSYRLFIYESERAIKQIDWRHHRYPISQMRGMQQSVPAFLINFHRIDNAKDAEAYIARLRGVGPLFAQLFTNIQTREKKGVMPPAFVFPMALRDCRNVLSGAPFEESDKTSTLLGDFQRKVDKLDIAQEEKAALGERASKALREVVKPAYIALIGVLEDQQKRASTDAGVWKLPRGDEFYRLALNFHTTTDVTAETLHQVGLDEVARIHEEMRQIIEKVGFKGSLQEFFVFIRNDPQFYFPNDDSGRAGYLKEVNAAIGAMRERLGDLFITLPKAPVVVKRVEAFREKSAGKAFYNRGTPDGSRPGIYYANLFDMASMPKYQLESLAFHEAIPGHHMQLSIAQELKGVPRFRQFARYTGYSEGWGLYSELVAKELGFYRDPYSDFGRLSMELWRALRLVVDTGIHHYKWTREKAIQYLLDNAPNSQRNARKSIERYIVMPGQATAYKVGMLKILELRKKSRAALGDSFDIREFHDVVLTNGPVPLSVLEQLVDSWISTKKAA